jgi:signal transduction histidine kinase
MASTRITQQLLSLEGEDPLKLIAQTTLEIADADLVTVVLPTTDGRRLMVEVAAGAGAEKLNGTTYAIEDTLAGLAFESGQPVLMGSVPDGGRFYVHLRKALPIGPVMALPLAGSDRPRGALVVGRRAGRLRFGDSDLNMATTFANHAALALELAAAREDQQRMLLLEDRDRIARDLHDHVIQRLFASGLTIQSVAGGLSGDPDRSERLIRVVDDIDTTIRQIRSSIFQLRGPLASGTNGLRAQLLAVGTDVTTMLGFKPEMLFEGPVDVVVPDDAVGDVVAVVREALTNAARHAAATEVHVLLQAVPGRLTVTVRDNGHGMGPDTRRSGLENLRRRAEAHGGDFMIISPAEPDDDMRFGRPATEGTTKGTELRWTIPLK